MVKINKTKIAEMADADRIVKNMVKSQKIRGE